MTKEFNLSDRVLNHNRGGDEADYFVIDIEDVKEFIKRLKEVYAENSYSERLTETLHEEIDKLAGEKLK